VLFSSGSTVQHFHARFDLPGLLKRFPEMKTVSIGPETTKMLEALAVKPSLEAEEHSAEGIVSELIRWAQKRAGKTKPTLRETPQPA
jgi:uroporphyrinogen-III synthase